MDVSVTEEEVKQVGATPDWGDWRPKTNIEENSYSHLQQQEASSQTCEQVFMSGFIPDAVTPSTSNKRVHSTEDKQLSGRMSQSIMSEVLKRTENNMHQYHSSIHVFTWRLHDSCVHTVSIEQS